MATSKIRGGGSKYIQQDDEPDDPLLNVSKFKLSINKSFMLQLCNYILDF